MTEVKSLLSPTTSAGMDVLAVQSFTGLHLEPPTKDVVEFDDDAEPVVKEEEVVTKKKTELTTTRQIETRVKRQVVLEDGKVVQDSGPIVETNTTEDTDKQESETTERRNLNDDVDGPKPIESGGQNAVIGTLSNLPPGLVRTTVQRPDGLVREVNTKKVVSREEIQERLETEDVKYLGDFSDEAYVNAVNSGQDIQSTLLSPSAQRQLAVAAVGGPRIVHQSTKAFKTIDTEDEDLKCLAQPDGTLVTEKKKTTEHEELFDEDLPDKDDHSTGSREKIDITESSQRYNKQRDEQAVEYVADGKIIGKEMRYAAETEQMERDGPPENPSDWDSLSDRLRKARRLQKTLLQQHREALLGDRKDALTERPLDFDKEEQTRKGETIKWLESHFGSESRSSRDSRDDEIEPTKKTFFNVTIKSNPTTPTTATAAKPFPPTDYNSNVTPTAKVVIPESQSQKKYFQGISEWSERKESTPSPPQQPPVANLTSKKFREELKGTLERNRLKSTAAASREDLRHISRHKKDDYDHRLNGKTEPKYGSRGDLRYRRDSRGGSDDQLRAQKEDLGYLSGSRNDVRHRVDSREEIYSKSKKQNDYLHRKDSGYIKDSREDIRYVRNGRDDSIIRDNSGEDEKYYRDEQKLNKQIIQRDDSAYVSSSTYFTAPRSPKLAKMQTPDSGIRSPSPDTYEMEDVVRPTVPQRKRVIERKLKLNQNGSMPHLEPPPDYSPPSRTRSISPPPQQQLLPHHHHSQQEVNKKYQRTRFAQSSEPQPRSIQKTQTIQTQTHQQPKQNKVSSVIGNSIRKLVGKIRSASVERKLKMKSKQQSPSPSHQNQHQPIQQSMSNGSSTYQQYNLIDSHIIGQQQHSSNNIRDNRGGSESINNSSVISGSRRERSYDHLRELSSDVDMASPKQKYYLGEDPYGGSIYGKENRYDGVRPQRNHSRRIRSEDTDHYNSPSRTLNNNNLPHTSSSTLGRFSKSTNRLITSTPTSTIHNDYRSTQTLPRRLEHRSVSHIPAHHQQQQQSSTINVSVVNSVKPQSNGYQQHTTHIIQQGPAKPARTYKALNRSKSFNVHGLNGTNDPSPIYMEKLNRQNFINSHSMYKSNPHLSEEKPQLKSPSIVNLISRSQRDLSKIDADYGTYVNGSNGVVDNRKYLPAKPDKRNLFLKGLHDQAPELFKTIHGDEENAIIKKSEYHRYGSIDRLGNRDHNNSSLGSRSPITINKDTASIVRRGSSSTEDYSETYKITSKSDDPQRPSITNTVHSFSKKTIPSKYGNGRTGGLETIESSERKTVTTSRYKGEPMSNLKYIEEQQRRGSNGIGGGPIVIEVRNRK